MKNEKPEPETPRHGAGLTLRPAATGLSLEGGADALLQQALNALIYGDASAATDAARIALARAEGPDREVYNGWATWMLGLAHLYASDAAGAAPYLLRAQELALTTHQSTLAMAVYLAQQLCMSYQQQNQMRRHASHLLEQLEENEIRLTQEFQAMLKLAHDAWPAMSGGLPQPSATEVVGGQHLPTAIGPRQSPLPPMRVQFLGPFHVMLGEREVSLRQSRKAADILKFMLAHRSRPTSQDTLLHTLWPDVEVETGAHLLHLAVSSLRQMLRVGDDDTPGYILFGDDAYCLNPLASTDLDVDHFLEYVRQGQTLDRAGRWPEALASYEAATRLYQGDYLTENLDDGWTAGTRAHLHETYLGVLARLGRSSEY